MSIIGRDILVISNEGWSNIWYSKHHYAHTLAQHNRVWFVDPPTSFRLQNLLRPAPRIDRLDDNLHLIRYSNPLPLSGRIDWVFRLNEKLVAKAIRKMLLARQVKNLLFWSFDPFRLVYPDWVGATNSIYHSMDFYNNQRESWLLAAVDGLVSVSPGIAAKFPNFDRPNTIVPHGIPAPKASVEEITQTPGEKRILLMGTLTERIDYGLLLQVAEEFPDYQLQLIGPVLDANWSEQDHSYAAALRQLPNVEWTGTVPWEDLETYLLKARLCLVALKQNQVGNQLNSMKVGHYLILGRPVVSTWLKDQQANSEADLLYLAKSESEFLYFCKQSLNGPDLAEARLKRYQFATQFNYSGLVERIGQFIQAF